MSLFRNIHIGLTLIFVEESLEKTSDPQG